MNKILLFISLGLIATGCSKSSSTSPTKTITTGLTGTYISYKSIDTIYNNQLVADGIESITLKSAYGDTTYSNPGTANASVQYNNIKNYNPAWETEDTVKFTSTTTALESSTYVSAVPFTYNLKAGTFNDGAIVDGSRIIERIVAVNATTVELIVNEQSGSLTGDVNATYYRKQ